MFKKMILFFIGVLSLLLTGCYDSNEIETFATVMAVGVEDAGEKDMRLYTFAVANMAGENEGDKASFTCYCEKAKDVSQAIENINRKISKKLNFSHTSLILYSAEIAGRGMYDEVKYFEENTKMRPQTLMSLIEASPQKYLETFNPGLESNPEKYFRNMLNGSKKQIPSATINDFTDAYYCEESITLPIIAGALGEETSEENTFVNFAGIVINGVYRKKLHLED